MNNSWRKDFPILSEQIRGNNLVYLDNAATTQKPQVVLDAIHNFYLHTNSNVHRGLHTLSERATDLFEASRASVAKFIGAAKPEEIVFVRGTTEAINLVANTFGKSRVGKGDVILVSGLEHHANLVPWQMLAASVGATIEVLPLDAATQIDMAKLSGMLTDKVKLLAITHASNVTGTITPVKEIIAAAHAKHIPVLVDGAQAVAHLPVDVQDLDADFYVFSGHKMYGPTGIGVLYGKYALLEQMQPYQGGGDMIDEVSYTSATYKLPPYRFEAGTPAIAEAIGLGAAVAYLEKIGMENVQAHEQELLTYATNALQQIPKVKIIGSAQNKVGVLSLVIDGAHPHDVATVLDEAGVAVRAGAHCAQPLMKLLGIGGTARASLALYTTHEDIDVLVAAVKKAVEILT